MTNNKTTDLVQKALSESPLTATVSCPRCEGRGHLKGRFTVACDECNGADASCPLCRGTGSFTATDVECSDCNGTGVLVCDLNDAVQSERFAEAVRAWLKKRNRVSVTVTASLPPDVSAGGRQLYEAACKRLVDMLGCEAVVTARGIVVESLDIDEYSELFDSEVSK